MFVSEVRILSSSGRRYSSAWIGIKARTYTFLTSVWDYVYSKALIPLC